MANKVKVTIYTRGIATPRGGAYGIVLIAGGRRKELSGGVVGASNNRMDLLAAIEALRALKCPCSVSLYNGNGYLTDPMTKGWVQQWEKNGWKTGGGKPTAHSDLWKQLLELCRGHEVEFIWLPSEPAVEEYHRCDELARQVTAEQIRQVMEHQSNAAAEG